MSRPEGHLTKYQLELLMLIQKAAEDEELIDFDQLLEQLSWQPTKASCHFSIRALTRRKLIEKTPTLLLRRGRQRVAFKLTLAAEMLLDPRLQPEAKPVYRTTKEDLPGVLEPVPDFEMPDFGPPTGLSPGAL